MFKNSDSKIGVRECSALILIVLYTKSTDETITSFFKAAKNAGWMVPIFSSLTILLPVSCILCLVKRYENKGLIEIVYALTGKYIGFVIGYWLLILNVMIVLVNIRDNCNTINTLFFPRTHLETLVFSYIGTGCLIATLGLKASARTSWLMLTYIELSLITLIILCFKLMVPSFLFPIAGSGITEVIGTGIAHASLFQCIILLSVCYPMFRNYKSFKTASIIGLLLSTLQLTFICLSFQMVFDYPAVNIIAFPLYTILRLINLTRFISNLEALLLLPSVIAQVLYYSIYLYLITALFTYTLKLKKVEPLILPVSALIILLSVIPESSTDFSAVIGSKLTPILTISIIILPLILLAISQLKGDYKTC